MLALFGTGYAAWTFSKDATVDSVANANITAVTDEGTLAVDKTSFYLVIDQNFLGWATTENATSSDLSTLTLTYTGTSETSVNETINFSCSINNALSSYITVADGSFSADSMTYTGTAIENTYTLPTVSWVDGKKPTTRAEYDAMLTVIGSEKVTFSFTADVAE